MPLPAEVRAIDHAGAVGRKIWPGFPVCFLVMNFLCLRARLRLHFPEAARAMNMALVRDKKDFLAVRVTRSD